MGRNGWIALAVVFALLLALLLWPEDDLDEAETWSVLDARPEGEWELSRPGLHQVVDADELRINGHPRPLDEEAVDALWRTLTRLETTVEPRAGVAPDALAAWGFDASTPRLRAAEVDLRWRREDGQLWIYDGIDRRMLRLPERAAGRLAAVAERLDHPQLLRLEERPVELAVDGIELLRGDDHWRFADDAQRPPADGRSTAMIRWLRALRCPELASEAAAPEHPARHRLGVDEHLVDLHPDGEGGLLAVTAGLPPQPVPAAMSDDLPELVASFAGDRALDLGLRGQSAALAERVEVRRGAQVAFTLERAGMDDVDPDGDSQWSLRWPGGLEPADPAIGRRVLAALQAVPIHDPEPHPARLGAPPPSDDPETVTVVLEGRLPGGSLWLQYDAEAVVSATHRGGVGELPELLQAPRPGMALQRSVITADPARVDKIQRAWHAPDFRAQVFTRERGLWSVVRAAGSAEAPIPATPEPISAAAIRRLATVVATTRAEAVAIDAARAQAIRADPRRRELALRIAPLVDVDAADVEYLEDTVPREVGLVLREAADGWEAAEVDGVLVWELASGSVERWFAEIGARSVLPIGPSRVRALEIEVPGRPAYTLRRQGEWVVETASGQSLPADQAAVRAYLLTLAELEWLEHQREAPPLAASGAISGVITVTSPGFGDLVRERTTLVLGRDHGDGTVAASIEDGRMILPATVLGELLPPVTAFLPADADPTP